MIVKMTIIGIGDLQVHIGSRPEWGPGISHVHRVLGLLQRKGKNMGKCISNLAVLEPVIFCMEGSVLRHVMGCCQIHS
jgi:hypothetical protein